MTTDPTTVRTGFGTITIGHELSETVTLTVDDRSGTQRVLVLQIDEAYQVIDAVQQAIRSALSHTAPSHPAE